MYDRVSVLIPQDAPVALWASVAIVASLRKWTVTASADDALLPPPSGGKRTVYVINPEAWGGLDALRDFAAERYPGPVEFLAVREATPFRAAFALTGGHQYLDIALTQKNPEWANEILGEGDETIGRAGCVLVCLTAALRMYGYDVTPPVVNRILLESQSVFAGSYLANWSALWKAAPVDKDVIYTNQKPSLTYIRTLLSSGYELVLPNTSFTHYYLAIEPTTQAVSVLDPETGQVQPLPAARFGGVRAFRIIGGKRQFAISSPPQQQPDRPAVPAPQIREGRLITAHLQSPSLPPVLAGYLARARSVKTMCPEAIGHLRTLAPVVYRPYFNDYDQGQIVQKATEDPAAAASMYLEGLRQRLMQSGLTLSDLAGCYVETLNECIGAPTPDDVFVAVVKMDCEIATRLEQFNVRAVMLNFPVGNPTEYQVRLMLPAAKLCERGHILGFHTYWPVIDGAVVWDQWRETAMRPLQIVDPILRKHGLKPLYFFGEVGAIKLTPSGFDPHSGWRSCYPSWGAFRQDLATFVSQVKDWESVNGRRVLGAALFTTNDFGAWPTFLIDQSEWEDLSDNPVG